MSSDRTTSAIAEPDEARPSSPPAMEYPGGKNGAGVWQTIINLMPPHRVYIEPFLGSGAVLRRKRAALENFGIDRDFAAVAAVREMLMCSRDFPRYKFNCGGGLAFLDKYQFDGDELVYCDPPYLMETRRSSRPIYRYEFATPEEHAALLCRLKALPCAVILSGYWSELYARELRDWNHRSFQAGTRGGPATEFVWFNYAPPVELHDYRFLGSTFRERERIKRKRERWKAKLRRMPELERYAILSAVADLRAGTSRQS